MATEEFKILSETLLENYLELEEKAITKGKKGLSASFKDYLGFYIKYKEATIQELLIDDIEEDEVDIVEDDEVHTSHLEQ